MAFRLNLSPETRARLDRQQQLAEQLYAVPDRWLARELLRMARQLRVSSPTIWAPTDCVYDATLYWHLIPELARRLGETVFLRHERSDAEINRLSNADLRSRTANAWNNTSRFDYPVESALFFRELANGSPVGYALDRLIDVAPDATDPFARRLREIAHYRGATTVNGWRNPRKSGD